MTEFTRKSIPALKDQIVHLKFYIGNAKLYAFQVAAMMSDGSAEIVED